MTRIECAAQRVKCACVKNILPAQPMYSRSLDSRLLLLIIERSRPANLYMNGRGNSMGLMSSGNEDTDEVTIAVGLVNELPRGRVAVVDTPSGQRIAVYNVNDELFATEDSCPHQDAPLSKGFLCGHVIECGLHGWQFDVRNGKCLTVEDSIKTFPVSVENGVIKISLTKQ